MPSRASWRRETTLRDRAWPNPFRHGFYWDLQPGGARIALLSGDDPPSTTLPAQPVLLTGGAANGVCATLDAIVTRARVDQWAVARITAKPDRPLRVLVADGLDRAVETIVRHAADDVDAAPTRAIVEAFRSNNEADDLAYAPVLGAIAAAAADTGWGVVLVVDDLHAAARRESEALLGAAAAVAAYKASFRAVVSATHRTSVATESATRHAWLETPLELTSAALTHVLDSVAERHERRFAPDAVGLLLRASSGSAEVAFAHAALAWESTDSTVISAERVEAAGERADVAYTAALRERWSKELSLGQRRYLRVVSDHGERGADIDAVTRTLDDVTRFGWSASMLDLVLTTLVQRGLLIVNDGMARIAVPGLSRIL